MVPERKRDELKDRISENSFLTMVCDEIERCLVMAYDYLDDSQNQDRTYHDLATHIVTEVSNVGMIISQVDEIINVSKHTSVDVDIYVACDFDFGHKKYKIGDGFRESLIRTDAQYDRYTELRARYDNEFLGSPLFHAIKKYVMKRQTIPSDTKLTITCSINTSRPATGRGKID
jgi:hypothetical protein